MKVFKGKVRLELRDAISGKLTDKFEGENTFTSALSSLFNDSKFGLANGHMGNADVAGTGIINNTPLKTKALGGVLMFEDFENPTNMNDLYESLANPPVAYASVENIATQGDAKLGTWNSVESSGFNDDTVLADRTAKQVTYVYDWGTSQGNGNIGVVALSHVGCPTWYNDPAHFMSINGGIGYYRKVNVPSAQEDVIGIGNGGYFTALASDSNTVKFYPLPENEFFMSMSWGEITSSNSIPAEWSNSTGAENYYPTVCYDRDNNKLYRVYIAEGSSSIKLNVFDCDNDFAESTSTITVSGATFKGTDYNNYSWGRSLGNVACIKDGYIYVLGSTLDKVYKVKLSDSSKTEIALPEAISLTNKRWDLRTDEECIYLLCVGGSGSGTQTFDYIIGFDGTVIKTATHWSNGIPVYRNGVWLYQNDWNGGIRLGKSVVAPYCATKYILNEPVTKSSSQTMKLTYTVSPAT